MAVGINLRGLCGRKVVVARETSSKLHGCTAQFKVSRLHIRKSVIVLKASRRPDPARANRRRSSGDGNSFKSDAIDDQDPTVSGAAAAYAEYGYVPDSGPSDPDSAALAAMARAKELAAARRARAAAAQDRVNEDRIRRANLQAYIASRGLGSISMFRDVALEGADEALAELRDADIEVLEARIAAEGGDLESDWAAVETARSTTGLAKATSTGKAPPQGRPVQGSGLMAPPSNPKVNRLRAQVTKMRRKRRLFGQADDNDDDDDEGDGSLFGDAYGSSSGSEDDAPLGYNYRPTRGAPPRPANPFVLLPKRPQGATSMDADAVMDKMLDEEVQQILRSSGGAGDAGAVDGGGGGNLYDVDDDLGLYGRGPGVAAEPTLVPKPSRLNDGGVTGGKKRGAAAAAPPPPSAASSRTGGRGVEPPAAREEDYQALMELLEALEADGQASSSSAQSDPWDSGDMYGAGGEASGSSTGGRQLPGGGVGSGGSSGKQGLTTTALLRDADKGLPAKPQLAARPTAGGAASGARQASGGVAGAVVGGSQGAVRQSGPGWFEQSDAAFLEELLSDDMFLSELDQQTSPPSASGRPRQQQLQQQIDDDLDLDLDSLLRSPPAADPGAGRPVLESKPLARRDPSAASSWSTSPNSYGSTSSSLSGTASGVSSGRKGGGSRGLSAAAAAQARRDQEELLRGFGADDDDEEPGDWIDRMDVRGGGSLRASGAQLPELLAKPSKQLAAPSSAGSTALTLGDIDDILADLSDGDGDENLDIPDMYDNAPAAAPPPTLARPSRKGVAAPASAQARPSGRDAAAAAVMPTRPPAKLAASRGSESRQEGLGAVAAAPKGAAQPAVVQPLSARGLEGAPSPFVAEEVASNRKGKAKKKPDSRAMAPETVSAPAPVAPFGATVAATGAAGPAAAEAGAASSATAMSEAAAVLTDRSKAAVLQRLEGKPLLTAPQPRQRSSAAAAAPSAASSGSVGRTAFTSPSTSDPASAAPAPQAPELSRINAAKKAWEEEADRPLSSAAGAAAGVEVRQSVSAASQLGEAATAAARVSLSGPGPEATAATASSVPTAAAAALSKSAEEVAASAASAAQRLRGLPLDSAGGPGRARAASGAGPSKARTSLDRPASTSAAASAPAGSLSSSSSSAAAPAPATPKRRERPAPLPRPSGLEAGAVGEARPSRKKDLPVLEPAFWEPLFEFSGAAGLAEDLQFPDEYPSALASSTSAGSGAEAGASQKPRAGRRGPPAGRPAATVRPWRAGQRSTGLPPPSPLPQISDAPEAAEGAGVGTAEVPSREYGSFNAVEVDAAASAAAAATAAAAGEDPFADLLWDDNAGATGLPSRSRPIVLALRMTTERPPQGPDLRQGWSGQQLQEQRRPHHGRDRQLRPDLDEGGEGGSRGGDSAVDSVAAARGSWIAPTQDRQGGRGEHGRDLDAAAARLGSRGVYGEHSGESRLPSKEGWSREDAADPKRQSGRGGDAAAAAATSWRPRSLPLQRQPAPPASPLISHNAEGNLAGPSGAGDAGAGDASADLAVGQPRIETLRHMITWGRVVKGFIESFDPTSQTALVSFPELANFPVRQPVAMRAEELLSGRDWVRLAAVLASTEAQDQFTAGEQQAGKVAGSNAGSAPTGQDIGGSGVGRSAARQDALAAAARRVWACITSVSLPVVGEDGGAPANEGQLAAAGRDGERLLNVTAAEVVLPSRRWWRSPSRQASRVVTENKGLDVIAHVISITDRGAFCELRLAQEVVVTASPQEGQGPSHGRESGGGGGEVGGGSGGGTHLLCFLPEGLMTAQLLDVWPTSVEEDKAQRRRRMVAAAAGLAARGTNTAALGGPIQVIGTAAGDREATGARSAAGSGAEAEGGGSDSRLVMRVGDAVEARIFGCSASLHNRDASVLLVVHLGQRQHVRTAALQRALGEAVEG